jgi:aspartate/methionine/tyrosine aminotransferase
VLINSLLVDTATPPIPEAKGWTGAYGGSAGPLIDLSQAVPGYPPHAELLGRLGEAAATREAASYGDIEGDPKLREAYAAHVAKVYGGRVAAENVAITAGCNQAFYVAMIALAKAGDAVLLPSPWYFNHKMTLDMLGIEAVPLPCRGEAGFVPDLDDARKLLSERVRAIVLVTPNNPTGAVYPPARIHAFQKLCAERAIALVIDETYRDFLAADAAQPHQAFADPEWQKALVQLYSFSKAYCIPGHRVGALIASREAIGEIAKILDCLQICAPRTAQLVLPWAIPALAEWREANRAEILGRADAFRAAIGTLDGWRIGSIGAYFAYLEHPYRGRTGAQVAEFLARERGVLALPGSYFGGGQEKFLRVAFANVGAADIAALPARLMETGGRKRSTAARRLQALSLLPGLTRQSIP